MSVTGGAAANDDHSDKHKLQVSAVTRSFQIQALDDSDLSWMESKLHRHFHQAPLLLGNREAQ